MYFNLEINYGLRILTVLNRFFFCYLDFKIYTHINHLKTEMALYYIYVD
jgi:hypothetical protein